MRMKLIFAAALIVGAAAMFLSAYREFFPDRTIERFYRIDLTVDTPEGPRSGETILRCRASPTLSRRDRRDFAYVKGEALPIEVSKGDYIFMLDDRPTRGWEVAAPWSSESDMADLERGRTVQFDRKYVPGFATFSDFRNPHSVREVRVGENGVLSPDGYAIRSMTVTRVKGPESHVLDRILPWLDDDHGNASSINEHGTSGRGTFVSMIDYSAFRREM